MNVYVASSWRNLYQPDVVELVRSLGIRCYDFRNPSVEGPPGAPASGFAWSEIDPDWQEWSPGAYRDLLTTHPRAASGFAADLGAMERADAFVLVLPCGRSAHLEAGWAIGAGKPTAIHFPEGVEVEPELMALLAETITIGKAELAAWLSSVKAPTATPLATLRVLVLAPPGRGTTRWVAQGVDVDLATSADDRTALIGAVQSQLRAQVELDRQRERPAFSRNRRSPEIFAQRYSQALPIGSFVLRCDQVDVGVELREFRR